MKKTVTFLLLLSFLNCRKDKESTHQFPDSKIEKIEVDYAKGFTIDSHGSFKVLEIKNPWPDSKKVYRYALIPKEMAPKITLNVDEYDGILITPIQQIVVTSTTHIPALELLNVEETLVGFPETDYISSEKTRARIDKGFIRNLGKNESINTEVLLEIKPDVVVGFGIDGNNRTFENIQKAGIPVIYDGDWVESSPLAKAEWIKFFGVLYHKEKEADSIFKKIESEYLEAKKLAATVQEIPAVLSGAMHKDIWYLPTGTSSEAQLFKDANVNYIWSDTTGSGSLALNFETVFEKAKNADLWFSPSYYSSLEALQNANEHYTKFKAFKTKNIYSFVNKTGVYGGVLYYELGMARPDLVLKDIVKISHPELLKNYEPYFFKRLE